MDAFVGSGTSVLTAAKLNRKAIGIDSNLSAILTTRGRLRRSQFDCSLHSTCQNFDYPSPSALSGSFVFTRPISPSDRFRNNAPPPPPPSKRLKCSFHINNGMLILSKIEAPLLKSQFPDTTDKRAWIQSVVIDFYTTEGPFCAPHLDQPRQTERIKGEYPIPIDALNARIRITDLLCNVFETTLSLRSKK